MTTAKELADKAKQQANAFALAYASRLARPGHSSFDADRASLHITIDQLQAMAEARQGSGEQGAYDLIDRFLRNNLYDDDYAEYSAALDKLYVVPPSAQQATGSTAWNPDRITWQGERYVKEAALSCNERDTIAQQATGKFFDRLQEIKATPAGREMLRQAMQGDEDCAKVTGSGQVLTDEQIKSIAHACGSVRMMSGLIPFARAVLAAATQAQPEVEAISDLSLLVARMARRLRITEPGSVHVAGNRALADQATDYLKRKRRLSPLRAVDTDCGEAGHDEGRCGNAGCAPTTGKREPLTPDHPDLIPRGFLLQWPAVGGKRYPVWNDTDAAAKSVGCPSEPLFALRDITGEQR